MDKDIIFKSAIFGGFNKQDVMQYLAAVNAENADLQQKYSTACADASSFLNKITELEQKLVEFTTVSQQLEEEKQKSAQLEKEMLKLSNENEGNLQKLNALIDEKEKLSVDREKLKAVELQLGAAMLDARLHSEKLISKANEKISDINKETGEAITKTASKMCDISTDIGEFAAVFNKAIAQLEERVRSIVDNMSSVADSLIKESQKNLKSDNEKTKNSSDSDDDSSGDSTSSVYIFG